MSVGHYDEPVVDAPVVNDSSINLGKSLGLHGNVFVGRINANKSSRTSYVVSSTNFLVWVFAMNRKVFTIHVTKLR